MFGKKPLAELKALVFLYGIDRCDGKRGAAKKLDVSVDTVTKYIEDFGQDSGTELLNTAGGGCKLTPRGLRLTEFVAEIEQELKHMYILVADKGKDEISGEVRLLWDHNIRANVMCTDLWAFMKKHKNINVISRSFNSADDLKNVGYDLAISYHLPAGSDWELVYSCPSEQYFFASSKYLAKYGYPLDLQDVLNNHRMIFKNDTADWLKNGAFLMENAKYKVYTSDTSFMINDAVSNGIGIGILPSSFIRSGLVCLGNVKCESTANIYVVVHREFKDFTRVKIVAEYLKECLKAI